jgi:hypothetical protein
MIDSAFYSRLFGLSGCKKIQLIHNSSLKKARGGVVVNHYKSKPIYRFAAHQIA